MTIEDVTVTIEADGETADVDLPVGLLSRLTEPDETHADAVGSIVLMSFVGRAHALAHHSEGETDEELEEIEDTMLERFEERFGVTYAEATGHSH